ncbi:hypothetical protein ACFOLJ_24490 [Rugamonas sp. CCM 8940]
MKLDSGDFDLAEKPCGRLPPMRRATGMSSAASSGANRRLVVASNSRW